MPVFRPMIDAESGSKITMKRLDYNSKRSSQSTDTENEEISSPFVAVPEKIVVCVDIAEDPNLVPYRRSDNTNFRPFEALKKALELFATNKLSLNQNHQFAFATVEPGGFKWVSDFSSNLQVISSVIDSLEPVEQTKPDICNFNTVFKEVKSKVGTLPVNTNNNVIPSHIVRLFLIYNSSMNKPFLNRRDESYKSLILSDNFFLDILYLHDPASAENYPQKIYSVLLSFIKGGSYFQEESRKVTQVFNTFARFLAHPFQRPYNEYEQQVLEMSENY
ncbi:BRISC and BRCA1-A complex member 1 [Nilaparvata lugens]|uniref:BRISC and BRCA1-A complex member 1 n=1 Tax=Nilaparvata lugens TaxID=108931 RepID=UPI00193D3D2E|nr:BRISC and BRCA1-A complex member 1 [Nilaparvata lugens]